MMKGKGKSKRKNEEKIRLSGNQETRKSKLQNKCMKSYFLYPDILIPRYPDFLDD